jgi:hypothetical protein
MTNKSTIEITTKETVVELENGVNVIKTKTLVTLL